MSLLTPPAPEENKYNQENFLATLRIILNQPETTNKVDTFNQVVNLLASQPTPHDVVTRDYVISHLKNYPPETRILTLQDSNLSLFLEGHLTDIVTGLDISAPFFSDLNNVLERLSKMPPSGIKIINFTMCSFSKNSYIGLFLSSHFAKEATTVTFELCKFPRVGRPLEFRYSGEMQKLALIHVFDNSYDNDLNLKTLGTRYGDYTKLEEFELSINISDEEDQDGNNTPSIDSFHALLRRKHIIETLTKLEINAYNAQFGQILATTISKNRLPKLKALGIEYCQYVSPKHIIQIINSEAGTRLKELNLKADNLTANLLSNLTKTKNLEELERLELGNLSNNTPVSSIIELVNRGHFPNLKQLKLSHPFFTPEEVTKIKGSRLIAQLDYFSITPDHEPSPEQIQKQIKNKISES